MLGRLRALLGGKLGTALKASVSLGIIAWFALTVDWDRLAAQVREIEPIYLAGLLFLSLARFVPTAWRPIPSPTCHGSRSTSGES